LALALLAAGTLMAAGCRTPGLVACGPADFHRDAFVYKPVDVPPPQQRPEALVDLGGRRGVGRLPRLDRADVDHLVAVAAPAGQLADELARVHGVIMPDRPPPGKAN
jgi:hypothetical protein